MKTIRFVLMVVMLLSVVSMAIHNTSRSSPSVVASAAQVQNAVSPAELAINQVPPLADVSPPDALSAFEGAPYVLLASYKSSDVPAVLIKPRSQFVKSNRQVASTFWMPERDRYFERLRL